MSFNQSTAFGASGDIAIGITPQETNDLVLVCSSAYNTPTHPTGWTRETSGLWRIVAPDTTPLTFDLPTPSPGPEWSALMLSLAPIGTPAVDQVVLVDFGTYPLASYNKTLTLNAGDCFIWQYSGFNTSTPSFGVSDTQGNTYTQFQFSQLIDGKVYTAFLAIAFGCAAGSNTSTITCNTPQVSGQGFDMNVVTYTGVKPPSPIQNVAFSFQDPQGNPLANGKLNIRLVYDASGGVVGGPQVTAGRKIIAQLDGSGSVTVPLWANDYLQPAGSKYKIVAFSYGGAAVYQSEITVSSD